MKIINIFEDRYDKNRDVIDLKNSCRGIVIKNNKILLSYEKNTENYSLPGGGREEGETDRDCCIRELLEETGIIIETDNPILEINHFFGNKKRINRYFICKAIGKTEQSLTEEEILLGTKPKWILTNEILKIFSEYENWKEKDIVRYRLYFREYTALKEILTLINL